MKLNEIKVGQEFSDLEVDEKVSIYRAESFGWRSWAITDNKGTIVIGWDIGNTNYKVQARIDFEEGGLKTTLKAIGVSTPSSKRAYLEACKEMKTSFLKEALESPTEYMKPIHLKLIAIELRSRGELPES